MMNEYITAAILFNKPKPFESLNHFTVPSAILFYSLVMGSPWEPFCYRVEASLDTSTGNPDVQTRQAMVTVVLLMPK